MDTVHVVALNDFGGLQTLFIALALHRAETGNPLRIINRAEEKPLDIFADQLKRVGYNVLSPRCSVPHRVAKLVPSRWVRRITQEITFRRIVQRSIARNDIDRVVFWNAIPYSAIVPNASEAILYDHGFSSIHKPTRKNRERLTGLRKIVAISNANKRLLEERWGWKGEVEILTNPLRQEIADEPLIPRQSLLREDEITIGCASRLVSFKGIASVIHAAALLAQRGINVTLRIAGEGPEKEYLKRIVKDLSLGDRVTFEGVVSNMPWFFSGIDVFVAPSLREPFGLAPMEAIASGVPTILSRVDGHTDSLPFEGAAIVLEPDLRLAEYAQLGASLYKMPTFVYSPKSDSLSIPHALNPEAITVALQNVKENYGSYARTTHLAGQLIRKRNSMDVYAENFSRVIEDNVQGANNLLAA